MNHIKHYWKKSKNILRLTNGNCSPPCLGGSGSAKHRSGNRPLRYFAPPHFASPGLASQALIRSGKTSVT